MGFLSSFSGRSVALELPLDGTGSGLAAKVGVQLRQQKQRMQGK